MPDDRIVEVYSAGNIVEASALCDRLREEGVEARVVGGMLGNALGWIPATDAAPRIWVRETDQARARQIIETFLSEPALEATEPEDSEFQEEPPEATETPEIDEQTPTGEESSGAIVHGLAVVGVACIVLGALHAAYRWTTIGKYSATAQGSLAASARRGVWRSTSRDLPIPQRSTEYPYFDVAYIYVVDGVQYRTLLGGRSGVADRVTIHYDPADPADCVAGALAPWWLSLVVGGVLGAFSLFMALRWR